MEALIDRASNDPDTQVRAAALRAHGEKSAEARVASLLGDALAGESNDVQLRAGALVGLSSLSTNNVFRKHIFEFYSQPQTRAAAVEAMWRSENQLYIPSFTQAIRDADPEVRLQAIRGVGSFPIPGLAIELVPLFGDEDLREDALYAYASAVAAKITPKSVHRLLEEIEKKADGLSQSEMESVTSALDRRLELEGFEPVFQPEEDHDHSECGHDHGDAPGAAKAAPASPVNGAVKAGRNDPCPCGSGKKFKKCCGQ
jgi:HEAT repeat protein